MALPTSGQIGFGQIITEFKGTNNQTENEISDYYSGAGLVTSSSSPNVPASGEIRWSDFYGASSVQSGFTNSSFTIPNGWITIDQEYMAGAFTETFSEVRFSNDSANNCVKVGFRNGGSQTTASIIWVNIPYQGFDNIASIEAMYNTSEQYCTGACYSGSFGPLPTNDGFNPNTYYDIYTNELDITGFGWMAKANPNASADSMVVAQDVEFSIKVTDSVAGTFTISSNNAIDIELDADTSSSSGSGDDGNFGLD
jgi:hypothetical protein